MKHIPVLEKEMVEALCVRENAIVVDGTVNGGGHAETITKLLGPKGIYIGIDLDQNALDNTRDRLANVLCKVYLEQSNYRNINRVLEKLGIETVDGAFFDLGLSSNQLEESGRGFSFLKDEPLLMTFKRRENITENDITAEEIVMTWDEEHIADILYGYGEERFSRKIARQIVKTRSETPIKTTTDLLRVIESAVPTWYTKKKTHFATKTFQALRITVNDEVESLREGLTKATDALNENGRIAVLSFHSIEDRIIKHFFIQQKKEGTGIIITKKPITPSKEEIKKNPRSRSAKLRIFEKYTKK